MNEDVVEKRVEQIGAALREGGIGKPDHITYERHRDDHFIDAVLIDTVPRYKTSGLSGDEWRFSTRIRLLRKGIVLYQRGVGSLGYAALAVTDMLEHLYDQDDYKVSDYDEKMKLLENKCANPGCTADAVSEYRLKQDYCQRCGKAHEIYGEHRIRFCQRHLKRGDCGLHDADANYEVVSGPGPDEAKGYHEDISESAFGGIIKL